MAIFSRNSGTELPSESQVEYSNRSGRRWPVLVGYIIAALLVATAVVFIGKWIYNQTTNNSDNTSDTSSSNQQSAKINQSQPPAPSTAPKSSPGAAGTTPTPSPSPSKKPVTPPSGNLPNNGPGPSNCLIRRYQHSSRWAT